MFIERDISLAGLLIEEMNKPNKIDFNTIFDELDNLYLKLLKMKPVGRCFEISPEKDISGIYLFSENGKTNLGSLV